MAIADRMLTPQRSPNRECIRRPLSMRTRRGASTSRSVPSFPIEYLSGSIVSCATRAPHLRTESGTESDHALRLEAR